MHARLTRWGLLAVHEARGASSRRAPSQQRLDAPRDAGGGRWSAERADEMAGVALRLAGSPDERGSSATARTRSSSCRPSGWRCG